MPLMPPPSMLNTVTIFPFAKPAAISIFKRAFRTVIQVCFSKLMSINVVYQAYIYIILIRAACVRHVLAMKKKYCNN